MKKGNKYILGMKIELVPRSAGDKPMRALGWACINLGPQYTKTSSSPFETGTADSVSDLFEQLGL